jgi:siroheme synthase (precorrin-2 oxidase/ferrochelatase)
LFARILPDSGQKSCQSPLVTAKVSRVHRKPPADPHHDLVVQLSRTTGLSTAVAARVLEDVLAYFGETVQEYVRRRHRELQRRGHSNEEIFERIAAELPARRVAAADLSQRQLRRLVYG